MSSSRGSPLKHRSGRKAISAEDARQDTRRRQPKMIFDFIEGGAGRERSLTVNRTEFDQIRLKPRILAKVERRFLTKSVLGYDFDLPFGIAPMGMCNLSWPKSDQIMAHEAVLKNFCFVSRPLLHPLLSKCTCGEAETSGNRFTREARLTARLDW